VRIPVTVKMRAGWNDHEINAPELAKRVEDAGAAAVTVHGRTAAQSYSGESDWDLIARVAGGVQIPVFGSGDCVAPDQLVTRTASAGIAGALVGRGALRNPWIFAQAQALEVHGSAEAVSPAERGRFLLEYIDLLLSDREDESDGFRHTIRSIEAVGVRGASSKRSASTRERWVVNKLRALGSWYTKGFDHGSQLRTSLNRAESIEELRTIICDFFLPDQSSSVAS
jgi:tRNA-dihydrouridine synthase